MPLRKPFSLKENALVEIKVSPTTINLSDFDGNLINLRHFLDNTGTVRFLLNTLCILRTILLEVQLPSCY